MARHEHMVSKIQARARALKGAPVVQPVIFLN